VLNSTASAKKPSNFRKRKPLANINASKTPSASSSKSCTITSMPKRTMTMMLVLNSPLKTVAVLETMAHQVPWLKKLVDSWMKVKTTFKPIMLELANRKMLVPKLKWVVLERNLRRRLELRLRPVPLSHLRATLKSWQHLPPLHHLEEVDRVAASARLIWNL